MPVFHHTLLIRGDVAKSRELFGSTWPRGLLGFSGSEALFERDALGFFAAFEAFLDVVFAFVVSHRGRT